MASLFSTNDAREMFEHLKIKWVNSCDDLTEECMIEMLFTTVLP